MRGVGDLSGPGQSTVHGVTAPAFLPPYQAENATGARSTMGVPGYPLIYRAPIRRATANEIRSMPFCDLASKKRSTAASSLVITVVVRLDG